jgi:hypothetical protein
MKPLLLLAAVAGSALAADGPRVTYTKSFPGSVPAYMSVTVDRGGAATYKESQDEQPDMFQLEAASTQAIFGLADKLEHFKKPLESGLKVARTGDKTFRWENGTEHSETTFNYSLDANARALQDWFERIGESQRLLYDLRQTMRHDKLGVNDALLHIDAEWSQSRLTGLAQFVPLMDKVAKDDSFINMARDRAGKLADAFRAAAKAAGE